MFVFLHANLAFYYYLLIYFFGSKNSDLFKFTECDDFNATATLAPSHFFTDPEKGRTGSSGAIGGFLRRALYIVVQSAGIATRYSVMAANEP